MGQDLQVLQGAPEVQVNDKVVINLDGNIVKRLQTYHGGWVDDMENCLGRRGMVVKFDILGNVQIRFINGRLYTYNPCIVAKILSKGDIVQITDNEAKAEFLQNEHGGWYPIMRCILGKEGKVQNVFSNYDVAVKIDGQTWRLNPLLCTVKRKSSDYSSSSGDDSGEDMFLRMFRQGAENTMEQLFHMHFSEMRAMMTSGLDKDGNTPLILAIRREEYDIIDSILSNQEIDLTKTNKKGFAAVHMAALKGDVKALEKLLQKKPDIVDMQKVDSYSALHITALNGYLEASKFLIQKGKAKLDIRTLYEETPLILAVKNKHLHIVKLLVSEGADINAQDGGGNTSLHHAIKSKIRLAGSFEMLMLTSLTKTSNADDVIIHLVENGASLSIKNLEGKTPLDMITDDKLKAEIQERAKSSHCVQEKMPCLLCLETKKLVKFQPCGHMKLCVECNNANRTMTKCMECKMEITGRIKPETDEKRKFALKRLFECGDRVCIDMDEELFVKQEANEYPNRKGLLKKIGIVTKIDEGCKLHVKFDDKEYKILPEMLTKVFLIGNKVEILKDVELVKTLQEGHGGCAEEMDGLIGKTGTVMKIEKGKISVKFGAKSYFLNPMACISSK